MPQCTATSKGSGERCKRLAVTGSTVCRVHGAGGGAPVKHGRYSKHLPKRLATRYRQLVSDRTLIDAQEHLALLETMLSERFAKLGEISPAEMWRSAIEAYQECRRAMSEGDTDGTIRSLSTLEHVLNNGLGQAQAERDIRDLIQEAVPVRRVELQRLYAEETKVTAKEVQALLAALLDAINRHVSDPDAKRAVSAEIVRLAG